MSLNIVPQPTCSLAAVFEVSMKAKHVLRDECDAKNEITHFLLLFERNALARISLEKKAYSCDFDF